MEAKTTKVRSLCWSLVSIEELTVKPKINLKNPDLYEVDAVVWEWEEEGGIKDLVLDITKLAHRLFEIVELEWNTWNITLFFFLGTFTWWTKISSNVWPSYISWIYVVSNFFLVPVHCSAALQLVLVIKLLGNHFQSQVQYFVGKNGIKLFINFFRDARMNSVLIQDNFCEIKGLLI